MQFLDECSPASVRLLQGLAAASSHRIRIIAIEHFERLTGGGANQPEAWLDKLPPETTNAILRTNFPEVPEETRERIVILSDGYIRFAALICRNESGLNLSDLTQTIQSVSQWVDHYLDDDVDCDLVGAIALFSRVGFRDEFRGELESLSDLTSTPIREIERRVEKIRNRTGFVTQQGQFWYVTPELIAPEMFRRGWRAFAENDLDSFVRTLPPPMLEQFKRRVEHYGGKEVAARVADYFRGLMVTLSIDDLLDADVVEFMVSIVKLDPSRYVHRIADLVENSSAEDIGKIGTQLGSGSWGPRRHLVWMFEKMALFPEFFLDAERALFKLASTETEDHIGNNATKIWATLWQIYFSNTSLPFDERLTVLKRRFDSPMSLGLCELAIDAMIGRTGGGPVPPPFYAGRPVPDVWSPQSRENERQYVEKEFASSPRHTMGLVEVIGNKMDLFSRILTSIENDELSSVDVVRLAYNFGGQPLPPEASLRLLESFACDDARFDREANWMVRLIHHLIMANRHGEAEQDILASPAFRVIARETLQKALPQLDRHSVGEWCQIGSRLIQRGDLECFKLFEEALGSDDPTLCRKSLTSLEELAEGYPVEVMDCFGRALAGDSGMYLRVHNCDSLLSALPKRVVLDWCDGKTTNEVKMIARHMPPPYQAGTSMNVPEVLDEFLISYGSDEIVAELHAGKNSSGVWNGPLSPQLKDEAERLTSLLSHPNQWIYRYAALERDYLLAWAEREQIREANEAIQHRTK
ncbi:hypothetical protein [Neorhodopirellula pilleata]|uniref:Uncharacterized protein n=1 Tax=Neorhodopirellula pilleata TaxID=2714738 RepID=A0A5C5ZX43_9BACT|nr:hypothetical protein [Neorhodopirellula pilleata]TWT91696.1 hypothetical protein Pla100_51380 [Neorhodopirellula pilleata]